MYGELHMSTDCIGKSVLKSVGKIREFFSRIVLLMLEGQVDKAEGKAFVTVWGK